MEDINDELILALLQRRETEKLVQLLDTDELDPFYETADGQTLAQLAVQYDNADFVEALIAVDADFTADMNPEDLLDLSIRLGHETITTLLLTTEDVDPVERLHAAVAGNDVEKIRALVNAGADINGTYDAPVAWYKEQQPLFQRDKDRFEGVTPLHLAAGTGKQEVAEVLLSLGAEIDAPQQDGSSRTPLHKAAIAGDVNMTKVLIANDADIDAADCWSETPLCKATRLGTDPQTHALSEKHAAVVDVLVLAQPLFGVGYNAQRCFIEDMQPAMFDHFAEAVRKNGAEERVQEETGKSLEEWGKEVRR